MRFGSLVLAALLIANAATAALLSTFDTDADGWNVIDTPFPLLDPALPDSVDAAIFSSMEGNPPGATALPDLFGDNSYLRAPAKLLGGQSEFVGGVRSYDYKLAAGAGRVDFTDAPNVLLQGNDLQLVTNVVQAPDFGFSSGNMELIGARFDVDLVGGCTTTDARLAMVLAGLDALYINAETARLVEETVFLDDVVLTPLPAPALLLGSAVLGRSVARWRAART